MDLDVAVHWVIDLNPKLEVTLVVKQLGETVEVQDDFELLCWDLVSVPSTPNAYMSLAESKQYIAKDYSKVNGLITEIICNATGVCPLC